MTRMLLAFGTLALAATVVGATAHKVQFTTTQKNDRPAAVIDPSAMMRAAPIDLPVESYSAN